MANISYCHERIECSVNNSKTASSSKRNLCWRPPSAVDFDISYLAVFITYSNGDGQTYAVNR